MPTLTITKSYSDGNTLTESMLDDIKGSVETFINGTGLDDSNLQDAGISKVKLTAAAQLYMVPTGAIMDWSVTAVPSGWLECIGQEVSQSTYAALFTLLGSSWNTFNGAASPSAGNFRLPNLSGQVTVGAGTYTDTVSGSITRTFQAIAGAEKHLLTGAESGTPVHNHTATDAGHTHNGRWTAAGASGAGIGGWGNATGYSSDGGVANSPGVINTGTASITVANASAANASSAHSIMQPYVVLRKIIKY